MAKRKALQKGNIKFNFNRNQAPTKETQSKIQAIFTEFFKDGKINNKIKRKGLRVQGQSSKFDGEKIS